MKRLVNRKVNAGLKAAGSLGMLAALLSIGGQAVASGNPIPADLVSGSCGHGTLTVLVEGHQRHVSCDNVDTHSGEAFFDIKHCQYHHCHTKRVHIQLPVLKVKKVAYKNDRVITTNASETFHINVSDNSNFQKNLALKSKQQRSLLVSSGHYSIDERAAGYKESIRCDDAGRSNTGSITVRVKPGEVVDCAVINEFIEPARVYPVHRPAPKHCSVKVYGSLGTARAAYAHNCPAPTFLPRKDCDAFHGGWVCSSQQIGRASPNH